ncbi:MAG: DUF192 domain-containing protein [Candidatus Manganitrophus sp.]|nr:DUF192 domain-containing protein [Candidatus Manganitrophus sp.]WDT71255.1 MAG: DUF192 domain-containing protein [Candidatus Manganitrophus sp.]WDT81441.1 MAG: DUF192 domain-containing protein [Candidatus Manganitrophus sp.]
MRKPIFIALLFLATALSWNSAFSEKPPARRTVIFPSGTQIHAEIADTPEARNTGLMFRDSLPPGGGMLFVFQEARPYLFWMKNCKFPIDIIWFNEQKEIIFISEKTPPCKADPCPNYGPLDKNALYVIEVASGFAAKENLKLGMKVRF